VVTCDACPVAVPGARQQVLLARLLLDANRVVARDELVDSVWDVDHPDNAHGDLHTVVLRLRRALARSGRPVPIVTQSGGYSIEVAEDALDLDRFNGLVEQARGVGDAPERVADLLQEALRLWRGEPLADVPSERLHREVVPVLIERRLAAMESCINAKLRLGRHGEVVGELSELTTRYPLRERFWVQRMLALYRCGRQAEALECYRAVSALLSEDLGVDPSPEVRELHARILRADPSLAEPSLGGDMAAVAVRASTPVPSQLPSDIADFTAQTGETERLCGWLAGAGGESAGSGGARIAVVTGQGGIGKTTLAVHVAHRLRAEFPDGQLFADLHAAGPSPVAPDMVLAGFLAAFGVVGQLLPERHEERVALYRSLADRRVLVLLDNAADETEVLFLMPGGSGCGVIVTSRDRLGGLAGACHVDLGTFSRHSSIEFLGRVIGADRVSRELEAADDLIGQCGGLPLALRIAAARLIAKPHWRIRDLARRLSDARRGLAELAHGRLDVRGSLALSYDGLAPEARGMFRRIGLLDTPDIPGWVGAALLDIGLTGGEDLLEQLVDARLLEASEHDLPDRLRYRCHDLIRVYARELALAEESPAERDAVLGRAFGGWLALAEQAHRVIYGGDFSLFHGSAPRWGCDGLPERLGITHRASDWMNGERFAFRAAVCQAADMGWAEISWDLAWTSTTLYEARGYFDDWRHTAQRALEACRHTGNRRGEAAMLRSLGSLANQLHAHDDGWTRCTEAGQLFGAMGDTYGVALSRNGLAVLELRWGRTAAALRGFEEARRVFRAEGDRFMEAAALRSIARGHLDQDDDAAAEPCIHQALDIFRELGSERGEVQALKVLGEVYIKQGRFAEAEAVFTDFLQTVREIGEQYGEAYGLVGLGEALAGHKPRLAAQPLRQALVLARRFTIPAIEERAMHALNALEQACSISPGADVRDD
jgi:DNA-binding SARP family transcriptional activator/tetratricopeptide (TPR) repeat protein